MEVIKIKGYKGLKSLVNNVMDAMDEIKTANLPEFELTLTLEESVEFYSDLSENGNAHLFTPTISVYEELKKQAETMEPSVITYLGPLGSKFKIITG